MAEATTTTQFMTPAEFEAFVQLPDNAHHLYELIAGEVVAVVTGDKSASVTAMMTTYIGMYLLQNPIGYITGSQGGFAIGQSRLIPDVGLTLYSRRAEPDTRPYPEGLDLAVEVVSPTDHFAKIHEYTIAGTVVWLIEPDTRTVRIFVAGQPVITLNDQETLTGGALLPGFSVPVARIFDAPKPSAS